MFAAAQPAQANPTTPVAYLYDCNSNTLDAGHRMCVMPAAVGTAAYNYDGVLRTASAGTAGAVDTARGHGIRGHVGLPGVVGYGYDDRQQVSGTSARSVAYRSAPQTARAPIRVNLGGEGEVARAINVQPARIGGNVDTAVENAQRVAAQSRQPVVMAEGNRLPFRTGSVDEVWTNNVPVGKGGGYFGPSFDPDEIFRILRPGGSWLGNSAP